jgi:hypothetical protein
VQERVLHHPRRGAPLGPGLGQVRQRDDRVAGGGRALLLPPPGRLDAVDAGAPRVVPDEGRRVCLGVGVRRAEAAHDVGRECREAVLGGGVAGGTEDAVEPGAQEGVAGVRVAGRGHGLYETIHARP